MYLLKMYTDNHLILWRIHRSSANSSKNLLRYTTDQFQLSQLPVIFFTARQGIYWCHPPQGQAGNTSWTDAPFSPPPSCRPWSHVGWHWGWGSRSADGTPGRGCGWGIPGGRYGYPPAHRCSAADPAQGGSRSCQPAGTDISSKVSTAPHNCCR